MTTFQTICCFIGALVLFALGALVVLLFFGFICIMIAEAYDKLQQRKLCEKRMEGKE